MPEAPSTARAARRRHDDALKHRVLDECRQPGASVARVALSHGLNANLVHKWRRTIGRASDVSSGMQPSRQELFVPVVVKLYGSLGPIAPVLVIVGGHAATSSDAKHNLWWSHVCSKSMMTRTVARPRVNGNNSGAVGPGPVALGSLSH